ncbi:GMC oxidoreductase-domain-containing protein [Leptodontidium sp. MPI-SDFR-AT-0119]|nr:GMC oxidoreductase-domain-containing protein [Leptodontidium sp. MPI-SDFR-AT-0119]
MNLEPDSGRRASLSAQSADMSPDYIIIGAGSSGLLIANRLSDNSNTRVVLIKPGSDDRNNESVTDPLNRNDNAHSPIDLDFTAGKFVGGTSMINGLMYVRAAASDIDAWEQLGATWWNWNTLWPFYKDIERFTDPTREQVEAGAGVIREYYGRNGDVAVGFPSHLLTGSFSSTLAATWEALGVSVCQDVIGGKVEGYTVRPMIVDSESGLRASAATTFYYPIADRPNIKLLQGTATNLVWGEARGQKQKATGVRYLDTDGQAHTILLNQPSGEVILAAGALVTPIILEASGVGNLSLLTKLGIDIKVALPGVGENLQDQLDLTLSYTAKNATPANLRNWAETVAFASNHVRPDAIESIFRCQHDLIFEKKVAIGEITMTSSKTITSQY